MLFQWAIGKTSPVIFALVYKNRPIVRILYSATKYMRYFGVEDHHTGESVALIRDRK